VKYSIVRLALSPKEDPGRRQEPYWSDIINLSLQTLSKRCTISSNFDI